MGFLTYWWHSDFNSQLNLETFISKNLYLNFLLFFLFSVAWISLLGFGSPILLISGILFGKWLGTIISVFSISTGSLILYSIAQFFFKDLVKDLLEKKFEKYILLFQKNEFFYLLLYRLVGGFGLPFFLQNLLPIVFSVKKKNLHQGFCDLQKTVFLFFISRKQFILCDLQKNMLFFFFWSTP